ncbi:MAG: glucosamine-6-phosphate deaminase [Acholeplasmatales bacterium]|jgi:glucosamine-6-phosphate deaminase|nr:glucosamine-6-phosphate deaminase [Acholeplasmataceae bacterium]MDY0114959.1 glucosamine-6-phosphate deaminase [Acholeplasmatales bacterium]MCK9233874.1 glucosamine-6-phosphate deaminase [Acholeplasmataceae bacterium]MCK9289135.1 glucosamine-6-phosphate deaminase [Acholeplasmataceae bacterium]MCK9427101.1 glucosamine-6-phosphate deaminase [Acholeplasmataceae bacterium]
MKVIINEKTILDQLVSKKIIDLVKSKPNANLGLATGSTPLGVYQNLVNDYQSNNTDYSQVKTFNLDEYLNLPLDHQQSYHTYMNKQLFDHLNINLENTHFPLENNYLNYPTLLKENPLDLQLLGIGSNGHIGFNEPGTAFNSTTNIVKLASETRNDNARFFSKLSDVPTEAISMGLKDIMMAKEIILMANGKNKAAAIYQLVKGLKSEEWPATILQDHPNVTLYLDFDAASLL